MDENFPSLHTGVVYFDVATIIITIFTLQLLCEERIVLLMIYDHDDKERVTACGILGSET